MPVLVLKLALTPLLIGGATLAARRWGPSIGGLIIALPLTSGPVLLFLAVDHGSAFAASAALGSLAGLAAIAAFCAAWSRVAQRSGPAACLAAATAMFVVAGVLLQPVVGGSVWVLLAVVLVAVAAATRLVPSSGADHPPVQHPRWDIPARTVVATGLVVGITAVAPLLGPHWSGLVATFPVYLAVLTAFTHHHAGVPAADDVLRGLLVGLYGTAAFYVIVNLGLEALGVVVTFAAAVALTLAIEAVALQVLRRPGLEPEPA